ncbi:MAG: YdeI/OmpD-associated family protein [Halobacteriota archaeon]
MTEAGVAVVEAAKRDGSWDAYDAVEQLTIPSDLEAAFADNKAAGQNFAAFSASNKKQLLRYVAVPSVLKRDKNGSRRLCTRQRRTKTRSRRPRARSNCHRKEI